MYAASVICDAKYVMIHNIIAYFLLFNCIMKYLEMLILN